MKKQPPKPSPKTDKPEVDVFSSPRERFQSVAKNLVNHQEMVDAPSFDTSADIALCQYAVDLGKSVMNAETALAAGYKLQGAVRLLSTFKTLAEQPKPEPARSNPDALRPTEPPRRQ